MSADQLKRLEAGIKAAHEAGNAEHVRKLGKEYRRLQQQNSQPTPNDNDKSTVFSDLGTAVSANVDPILEGFADTAEVIGADRAAQGLRDATSLPDDFESQGNRFLNEDGEGFEWSALPGAAAEQIGQFGGTVAAGTAGARTGAGIGRFLGPQAAAIGGVAGGLLGAGAFEAAQVFGPTAKARAENNNREDPNASDILGAAGTATASGALNALTPGVTGAGRRIATEALTEGSQSAIQQTGETALTESGLEVSGKQAIGEGIIGGVGAGTFDAGVVTAKAPVKAAKATSRAIRTDNREFTDAEVRAAERLVRASDGNPKAIANVDDTGGGTAKGVANSALREIRGEAGVIVSGLRKLAKARKDTQAEAALQTTQNTLGNQQSPTPQSFLDALEIHFPNEPDVQRLKSLHGEMNTIQEFVRNGTNDMGGLSSLTRLLDITDNRNSLKLAGYASIGSNLARTGATIAGGAVVNRAARQIDKLTNRRSRPKRFVDSVRESGRIAPDILGPNAQASIDAINQEKALAKAVDRAAKKGVVLTQADRDAVKAGRTPPSLDRSKGQAQQRPSAQAEVKAQKEAERFLTNSFATEDLFEEGVTVPLNDPNPMVQGYARWQEATGATPADTLDVLEQLEREGRIPQGTPQMFREDIQALSKNQNTPAIQRQVRQRLNPDHTPDFTKFRNSNKNPEAVLAKFEASSRKPKGNRRKDKAEEGSRRAQKLNAEIEMGQKSMNSEEQAVLLNLKETIDSPAVTRSERFRIVNETLDKLFSANPALSEYWKKKFNPLAAIGNDYPIYREDVEPDTEQKGKEDELKKNREKAKRKKKKSNPSSEDNSQTDDGLSSETTGERALKKLNSANTDEAPSGYKPDEVSDVERHRQATEPDRPVIEKPKREKKPKLKEMVDNRVEDLFYAVALAEGESEALDNYLSNLPRNNSGRVENLIYQNANDRITVNMLADQFSNTYDVPPVQAAEIVNSVLSEMEETGKVKRFKPRGSDLLKSDGKVVRDEEGKNLNVLQIEFLDQDMKERLEVAKARRKAERLVVQEDPQVPYSPRNLQDGAFQALKDIPADRVDGTFTPLLNFLNGLRFSRLGISDKMMTQIEEGLEGTGAKRLGTIGEVMRPRGRDGKPDFTPIRTFAHLQFQLGPKDLRADTRIRQEWKAGANGRVYSMNGPAHSQAGDMMKGIMRAPERHKLGGERGLNFLFHGIGNLLGFDKKSPAERRASIFQNDMVDDLVKFSENPFGRSTLKSKDSKTTRIGEIVKDSEGFFQALNAANEVKDMVDWARARHPDKSKSSNADLLSDPEVRQDLSENYDTDFMVQLDASNNAYQIAGMVMGNQDILKSTGLLPPDGAEGDPDFRQGADIYLSPSLSIAERIPELSALDLPDAKLRKLFKGPIGTYLYAAEFNSRQEAFQDILEDIADGADVFGIDGDGLIEIPKVALDGLKSEQGYIFEDPTFDINGEEKGTKTNRKRVVKSGEKYVVETGEGLGGKFKRGGKKFDSEAEAMKYVYGMNTYSRMNRELVREMNSRFPDIRKYLDFSQTVSEIAKDKGKESITVPTKDGMRLEYKFKQNKKFEKVPTTLQDGNVVNIGVQSTDYDLAGRGLAAFMTHQNDAWALRETARRLPDMKAFNPIHDSYGFHPSDASKGQETWVEVMQELGAEDYNIFQQILEENGITLEEYIAAGGDRELILNRQAVPRVPASDIPTALS